MIAAAAIALIVAPLAVLRRRTLLAYYGVLAATSIFGWILFQRVPWYDPRLACIVVAAVDLAALSLLLARGRDVVWSPNRAAALAAIVYALVIPVIGAHAPNGDEPYYLAVSESLVHDFDFDLRNQYAAHKMGPQYNDPVGPNGEQYSRHEPFLSVLLVPGFALAGATGAIATLALFGVLLVRSTFRWMEDEGVPDAHARAVFPFFAFGAPVLFYATRMWPEVPAAFFFVEALRGARNQRLKRWLPALLGLVMLKLRFLLVAVGLVATMLLDRRPMRAQGGGRRTTLIIAAAVLVVPLAVLYFLTGSATNVHSWRELLPAPAHRYVVGFFGLLADGFGGIPFQAPFYLFGWFAITRWRSTPRGFRSGMLAGALYILYLLPRPEWYGGWAPPLRYLVFLMPVLALGAASVWDRISRGAIAIAAVWTIGVTVHGLAYPYRLFHIANGETPAGEWLSHLYQSDFSRLIPSFIRPNEARWIGVAVVLALLTIGLRRWKHDLAIPLFALALAVGFTYARKPGSRIDFEDAHVVKNGGKLYPHEYEMSRFWFRSGWVLDAGQSVSFLARRGTHTLEFVTGLGAVFELAGRAYHVDPAHGYQRIRITIPEHGRVTLHCVSGGINLERMEHESR